MPKCEVLIGPRSTEGATAIGHVHHLDARLTSNSNSRNSLLRQRRPRQYPLYDYLFSPTLSMPR
jgi:hypothetical protein